MKRQGGALQPSTKTVWKHVAPLPYESEALWYGRWFLWCAAPSEARVEATFPHGEAAAQPGEEALQAKPVATVGGGAVSGLDF